MMLPARTSCFWSKAVLYSIFLFALTFENNVKPGDNISGEPVPVVGPN